jgi:type II secretory pathway component PulF
MPQYVYRAKDSSLHVVQGMIEADNETAALSHLGSQGVFPISIAEAGSGSGVGRLTWMGQRRVSVETLAYTTRQLSDLLSGGLPLLGALTLLSKQTEHPRLRRVIDDLASSVRDGRSLSESLAAHPLVFPRLYVSMVRAGEVGGALDAALSRLADLGEHEAQLRGQIINASVYPVFVLVVALGLTGFLIAWVIPKLSEVFIESGQQLPLPTRMLLALSQSLTQGWWAYLLAAIIGWWMLTAWLRSAPGKAMRDYALMSMPGIRTLAGQIETARFARTLGAMMSQGVPVMQALEVVGQNMGNTLHRQAVVKVQEAVREGSSIAAALTASGQFPVFVSNMVAVGEEAGKIDSSLLKVAATYEREVDRTIRALTTVLEPVLLLGVGGMVMFIVLAMLLPVFQIGLVIQ